MLDLGAITATLVGGLVTSRLAPFGPTAFGRASCVARILQLVYLPAVYYADHDVNHAPVQPGHLRRKKLNGPRDLRNTGTRSSRSPGRK